MSKLLCKQISDILGMKRITDKEAEMCMAKDKSNYAQVVLQHTLELIYNRLVEFLKEDRRFTNDGLTRESVAASLKTNEKYLCAAIRLYSEEKTLNKLICRMRVQYAAELLINHSDYTVEAISQECGIKSRCSFYRMFINHYQCTPIDFRHKFLKNRPYEKQSDDENELKFKKRHMKWKLSNEVLMQDIGNKKVLVALNMGAVDYSQVITLNGTAAYVVELIKKEAYSVDELTMYVCEKYDIDEETAGKDVKKLIEDLDSLHVIYSND